jgi:TldD protein
MRVALSAFLHEQTTLLKELIKQLSALFPYVSVLASDTNGKIFRVRKTGSSLSDSDWSERGFVVRVHNGVNYSEYSFNLLNDENLSAICDYIILLAQNDLDKIKSSGIPFNQYPLIHDEPLQESFFTEVELHPKHISSESKLEKLTNLMNQGLAMSEELVDFRVQYEEVQVSKVFISTNRHLAQSYIWTTATLIPIAVRDGLMKYTYKGISGLKGVELIDELPPLCHTAIHEIDQLLRSTKIESGEYDVICDPEMSGLIAHEAFGHGVEMDMFVKNRAKAMEYMNKRVASDKVVMYDGARSANEVSSYLFDDEGTLGTSTRIINNGILESGISDLLSSLKLGTAPTGNGKRESFERKAYARMTNTFFAGGSDTLEDMVSSIQKGYLLEGFQSGMEDPKNWGIQCVVLKGTEIVDGKLTDRIVSPIYMTGYVPDLLESITMVSSDIKLSGGGACGKGHKEYVKTSTGGPYIKCRGRLS